MNNLKRCFWCDSIKPDYLDYHDKEWGVPVHDDRLLFEYLILEGAQAGLSWYTVLTKRPRYRELFCNFEAEKIVDFDDEKIAAVLADPGIIRHRGKVEATVGNARAFLKVCEEFGAFNSYIWQFVEGKPVVNNIRTPEDYVSSSLESDAMSRDLKKRGFKFVGSTICYAYMQAVGMVNDHQVDCFRYHEIIGL